MTTEELPVQCLLADIAIRGNNGLRSPGPARGLHRGHGTSPRVISWVQGRRTGDRFRAVALFDFVTCSHCLMCCSGEVLGFRSQVAVLVADVAVEVADGGPGPRSCCEVFVTGEVLFAAGEMHAGGAEIAVPDFGVVEVEFLH